MPASPPSFSYGCKYGRGASLYEDASLLGVKMMRKAEDQRGEKPMPVALREEIVNHLAGVLVAEIRERNENKRTVESRRGMNRKARNTAIRKGCALERGSAL